MTNLGPVVSAASPEIAAVPNAAWAMQAARAIGSFPGTASSAGKSGTSEGRISRGTSQPVRDPGAAASGLLHDPALKPAKAEANLDSDGQRPAVSERGSAGESGAPGSRAHAAAADLQAAATPVGIAAPAIAAPVAGNSTVFASGSETAGSDRQGVGAGSPAAESAGAVSFGHADEADRPAPTSINTARVLQSMQGSEMRVGMHSVEFGSVSINTSVTHGAVAAQISFEHAELGRALAAHLPAMEARLSRDSGVDARVEIRQGSSESSMDTLGGQGRADSQRQGQNGSNHAPHGLPGSLGAESAEMRAGPAELLAVSAASGRLDIRI